MVIGDTARFSSEYAEEVEELVNYLKIPTFVGMMSRGVFADESANELFTIGNGAVVAQTLYLN